MMERRIKHSRKRNKKLEPYLYLAPAFVLFGLFTFYPLVRTMIMSVSAVDTMGIIVRFNGLSNFRKLFASEQFWVNLKNTFILAVCLVPLELLTGLALGLLADNRRKNSGLFRTVFALPMSVSYACGAMIWLIMFNPNVGVVNNLLGRQINWTGDKFYAMLMIVITTCWLTAGMNFVYVLSGLQSVPNELYESCRIDGAGFWQMVRHITLPFISPTLFFLLIINTINAFQTFTQVRLMTEGGPGGSTAVLAYSIYESAFISNRWGNASAQSIVFFVLLMLISAVQFRLEKKGVFYQ